MTANEDEVCCGLCGQTQHMAATVRQVVLVAAMALVTQLALVMPSFMEFLVASAA